MITRPEALADQATRKCSHRLVVAFAHQPVPGTTRGVCRDCCAALIRRRTEACARLVRKYEFGAEMAAEIRALNRKKRQ